MNKNTVAALVVGGVALGWKFINYLTDKRMMVHTEHYNDSVVKFYEVLSKSGSVDKITNGPSFIYVTRGNSVKKENGKEES